MGDSYLRNPNHQCNLCKMQFNSQQMLTKHKHKFCIGSDTELGDRQNRRGFRSTTPPRYPTPDDRDEYRRPNPNLQSLAADHGRRMEYLQLQNKELEKQREDIMKRLQGLGRRPVQQPNDNAELMRELREAERRNQDSLDSLRKQLYDMNNNQKVNVIEVPVERAPPPPPPPPPPEPKKNLVLPIYYGKSIVAEICAFRQAYLQGGGNDPNVLAQMSQMQAEAQAIEDEQNQKAEKKSPREKPDKNADMVKYLDSENERLKNELQFLHEQKLLAQNRGKEDELEREIRRLQKAHMERMGLLQREMDDMKMMLMMERNKPQPQPNTIIHQAPQNPVNMKPYLEVGPMAPHDPYLNHFLPMCIPYDNNYDTQAYRKAKIPEFPQSRLQTANGELVSQSTPADGPDNNLDTEGYEQLDRPHYQ